MKTTFFGALSGSCVGVAIFERLRNQSLGRAFLHLFMMAIISAIIIAVGIYPVLKRSLHDSLATVVENCGSIICTADRIEPGAHPEKSRSFLINGPWSITYLPVNANKIPDDFQQGCYQGILWCADGRFMIWRELSGEKFAVMHVGTPLGTVEGAELYGKSALLTELKKVHPIRLELPDGKKEELTPAKMQALTDWALAIGMSGYLLRKTLLEVIIYIGMFVVVTLLMNIGRPRRLPARELIVLAIYAGFPPMLIGSLAEALGLPYLSFNIIYVLGMTFYLIFIMNRLERLRQEQEWHTPEQ